MTKRSDVVRGIVSGLCFAGASLAGMVFGGVVMQRSLDERARLDALAVEQALEDAARWQLKYEECARGPLNKAERWEIGTGVVR